MSLSFLLIHSPLVGPYTWRPTAAALRRAGYSAVIPALTNNRQSPLPYYAQHIQSIAGAYNQYLQGRPAVLVAHSGAGMLLPLAGQAIGNPAGYIFADAGLPHHNKSRLDLFPRAEAGRFRKAAANGYIPLWTEDALASAIPDPVTRHNFVSEFQPVPLAVYEEPIPTPGLWPDAPSAYLSFSRSTAYAPDIAYANAHGWPHTVLQGYHFHPLVDPLAVADALIDLARQLVA